MKFKLQHVYTHKYDTPLIFFADPGDECSIAVWYNKQTLNMTALYRSGVSLTRSLSKAQRSAINEVIIPLIVRAELEGFVNSDEPPEVWAELPL